MCVVEVLAVWLLHVLANCKLRCFAAAAAAAAAISALALTTATTVLVYALLAHKSATASAWMSQATWPTVAAAAM
jgi:hypothetical protein